MGQLHYYQLWTPATTSRGCHINATCSSICIHHLDQEITDNCRRVQIYNDIHIITWKYTEEMAVLIIED